MSTTICPICKGQRYLVERAGERSAARVCACNDSCKTCQGSGRVFVEKDGYTFVRSCSCRSVAQRVMRFNQAGLPSRCAECTFDTFEPENTEHLKALETARITAVRYNSEKPPKGFIVAGPVGTGKTHLLCATLRHLTLENGVFARYVETSFLFSEIRRGFSEGRSGLDAILPLVEVDVLAVDELGKGRGSPFEMDTLDELIARRYNAGRTTIFASNSSLVAISSRHDGYVNPYEKEQAMQQLLRQRIGERIYSRLFEMCHAIEFPISTHDRRKGDRVSLVTR